MDKKPIYQAVISLEPFLLKEYKDFKSACQIDCIFIIKKMCIETHTTYSGNKYEIYNYSFLDKKNKGISFTIRKWSIVEIYDGYFGSQEKKSSIRWSAWNDYLICDPDGELRRIKFATPQEAIENLELFSRYQNWGVYNL